LNPRDRISDQFTGSFVIFTCHLTLLQQIEASKMCRSCSYDGGDKEYAQNFGGETSWRSDT